MTDSVGLGAPSPFLIEGQAHTVCAPVIQERTQLQGGESSRLGTYRVRRGIT